MLNAWSKLHYVEPKTKLQQLRKFQELVSVSDLNLHFKNLRTNGLKRYREGWEAALFCYGMSNLLDTSVYVALHEEADFDAIALRIENGVQVYTPIQIKELVPESLNPDTDLNIEIEKLAKYPTSKDCVVVIHHTREGKLDLSNVKVPNLQIGGLWILGASKPDQNKWFIAGDFLETPQIYEFDFPATAQ